MSNMQRVRMLIGGAVTLLILAAVPLGVSLVRAATPSVVPSAAAPAVAQVTIPELGVSLPVPGELKDLKYSVDRTSVPGITVAYLSTTALERLDDATTRCDATQAALGAIWRVAQNPATTPDMQYRAAKLVGGSYLVYEAPQSGCSAIPAVYQQQMRLVGLLSEAISGAQASTTGVAQ